MAKRISIDLTDAANAELDRVKKATGLATADVFRFAFALMRIYIDADKVGDQMHVVTGKGSSRTRIVLPFVTE